MEDLRKLRVLQRVIVLGGGLIHEKKEGSGCRLDGPLQLEMDKEQLVVQGTF